MADENCLHCKINALIDEHVEANQQIDVGELVSMVAQNLADVILSVPVEEQSKLIAHAIAELGGFLLDKGGATPGDTTH